MNDQNKNLAPELGSQSSHVKQGGEKIMATSVVRDIDSTLGNVSKMLGKGKPDVVSKINKQLEKTGGKLNPDGTLDIGQGMHLDQIKKTLDKNKSALEFMGRQKFEEIPQQDGSTEWMINSGKADDGNIMINIGDIIKGFLMLMGLEDTAGDYDNETKEFYGRIGAGLAAKEGADASSYNQVLDKISRIQYSNFLEKTNNLDPSGSQIDEVMQDLGIDSANKKAFTKILHDMKANKDKISSQLSVGDMTRVRDAIRIVYDGQYGRASGTFSLDTDQSRGYERSSRGNNYNTKEIMSRLGGSREQIEGWMTKVNFLGASLTVNKVMAPAMEAAQAEMLDYVKNNPNDPYVQRDHGVYKLNPGKCGGYVFRGKANGKGGYADVMANPSNHATGLAVDFNHNDNPYITSFNGNPFDKCSLPVYFVNIMKKHGFTWGGDWKQPYDAMHFEYTRKDLVDAGISKPKTA